MLKKTIAGILSGLLLAIMLAGCDDGGAILRSNHILICLTVGEQAYIRTEAESEWEADGDCVVLETTGIGYIKIIGAHEGAVKLKGEREYHVSVTSAPYSNFRLEQSRITIDLEANAYATVTVEGHSADEYRYEVGNPDIASVDDGGIVRGRRSGVTHIMVTDKKTNLTKQVVLAVTGTAALSYEKSIDTGLTDATGHVQGVDTDRYGDYFYYSFTDRLVKQSADGTMIGSVVGFGENGHLGDVAYNKQDGRVYVTYTRKISYGAIPAGDESCRNCFVIIFDVDKIDRMNMSPDEVCSCVYVGESIVAFSSAVGYSQSPVATGGKYGIVNAVDSCTFGPAFGSDDGKYYLTLGIGQAAASSEADGVSPSKREDNDYQPIMQFDVTEWSGYEKPFSQIDSVGGPHTYDGIYFYYFGYHDYGIQNLCYDEFTGTYLMSAYAVGKEDRFPSYMFFLLDASVSKEAVLLGNGGESAQCLEAKYGLEHAATGIKGYNFSCSVGLVSMKNGYYYVCDNYAQNKKQGAVLNLYRWDLDAENIDTAKNAITAVQ